MNVIKLFKLIVLIYILFIVFAAELNFSYLKADTIVAASCSQSDVQAAINAADTVIIPAGICTWTSPVFIENKSIFIQGAGIDQTVIINAVPKTDHRDTPFWIEGAEEKPFRITEMTFQGGGSGGNSDFGAIFVGGTRKNWRIDHCKFDNLNGRAIRIGGKTFGVIDHCQFNMKTQAIYVANDNDGSWRSPLSLGTSDAVFVEDCNFIFVGNGTMAAIDGGGGCRYVFRYNTCTGIHVINHGTDTSGIIRSAFSVEIYHNALTHSNNWFSAVHLRGGTGIIFNNTFNGYQNGIIVDNYRSHQAYPPWGKCDGSSPYDGNEEPNGYPCIDQIGRSTDSGPGTAQALEPLYEWNNTLDGADVDISSNSQHVQENRDYYNDTPLTGYQPYQYPHPLTRSAPSTPRNFRVE
jgi:hypothetical protein